MSLMCRECGLPVVPFGGEDICLDSCRHCGAHECDCEANALSELDGQDEYDDDFGDAMEAAAEVVLKACEEEDDKGRPRPL